MPIYYDVQERINPRDLAAPRKYYLIQKSLGTLNLDFFIEDIVRNKSLTKEEALTGISYFFESIRKYLKEGYTINIKGIGHFYISIRSEGSNTAEEANYHKKKTLKLQFVPSKTLIKEIEKIPVKKSPFKTIESLPREWKVKTAIEKAHAYEIAEKSLKEGLSPELVIKITNLTLEEINIIELNLNK